MGGGKGGNFGGTSGSIGESSSQKVLDAISAFLSAVAWIPGIDTFADLFAIPVDIARDDRISAGLDLLGVIPFVGEIGDVAKAAKIADDIADTAKTADKAIDAAKTAKKVHNSYEKVIENLPKNPKNLLKKGWEDSTPIGMSRNTSSKMYTNKKTGLKIRFDKGEPSATGFGGKDHYHVLNPNSTGKHDYYLDKNGNPVPKNSKASHIIP